MICCKCNSEQGCYWEPSVDQFECIPESQCELLSKIIWIEELDSVQYRKGTNGTITMPLSLSEIFEKAVSLAAIKFSVF